MEEFEIPLDFYAGQDLVKQFSKATDLQKNHDLEDFELRGVDKITTEFQHSINFIITLGGDGTILWASK